MQGGRNPVRRSRNIGTAAQGHGRDGELKIPGPEAFWEKLHNPVWLQRQFGGCIIRLAIEPTKAGWFHSTTPHDIFTLLRLIPNAHLPGLVVLRQPTRKQNLVEPVWGRFITGVEVGSYFEPCVILEAVPAETKWGWRRPGPMDAAEIERLRKDGHRVTQVRRGVAIESDLASARATQLFRTLPHEIGHHVDVLDNVDAGSDAGWRQRWARYWARPEMEREAYAHRYADEFRSREERRGSIPFPQVDDPATLLADGVDPSWFGLGISTG